MTVVLVAWFRLATGSSEAPIRIAVMPFTGAIVRAQCDDLDETLVKILTTQHKPLFEVIGPTTTEHYKVRPSWFRQLVETLEIDYVVNSRESSRDSRARLYIEIIRASDGAHVWASYLDEFPTDKDPAETLAAAITEVAR